MIDESFCQLEPLLGTTAACAAVGRARATHYRHLRPGRTTSPKSRPVPPNKLADAEVDEILTVLRRPGSSTIAASTVQRHLVTHGLGRRSLRVARAAAITA